MTKGMVFNIQKFSIHDGPGIRTTVFLKGCPLRCEWCANPESQLEKVQILWDEKKCSFCKTCINTCPKKAIALVNEHILVDFASCVGCLACTKNCPNNALSFEGEYKSVEEVMKVVMQDYDFYEESDGGVTISGGEGMSQPVFAKALVKACHEQKLHVAIETTGYIEENIFRDLAKDFDLLLFDVKHYDAKKHEQKTLVSNELIKKNLIWAIENQIEVLPRIPVIPDFNATIEDARGLAAYLIEVGAKRVQLLPFHQFGENKYKHLNRLYKYENYKALYKEDLLDYQKVFLEAGLDCFF